MPRPKTDDLVIANVIEVYVNGEPKLTAEQVTNEVKRTLGARAPSLRKVQEILKGHREIVAYIEDQPVLSPLGEGWPRDPDIVHYLWALSRIWNEHKVYGSQPIWTQSFIDTAYELKGVLGWPGEFENRKSWQLANPYGGTSPIAGELAVIGEISNRRVVCEATGKNLPLNDLYAILLGKPWANPDWQLYLGSFPYPRVMVDGIATALSIDIFLGKEDVQRKISAAYSARHHWESDYYHHGIDHHEVKAVAIERELAILREVNALESEAAIAFQEFLKDVEELPQISYITRCIDSLLEYWCYTWDLVDGNQNVLPEFTKENLEDSFNFRSESQPERWVPPEIPPPHDPNF